MRAILSYPPFRRLAITLALSSFGDWLGLLATTVIAADQVTGTTARGAAFGGVVVIRLLPALLLAPLAGAIADRFDRRVVMVVCDVLRFALFASIPLVGNIGWTLAAAFLIEVASMFWIPAKEAAVPNLVRRDRLEAANQISLVTTYGLTPVVAGVAFAALTGLTRLLSDHVPYRAFQYFANNRVDLSLYVNALTFLVAAVVVLRIPQISGRGRGAAGAEAAPEPPSVIAATREGWVYVRSSPLVRGLVIGIVGALSAGGVVIGTGQFYAESLGGGTAAFGLLFGALFVGLGAGMALGPKLVGTLSRRRWFALSIVLAGAAVALLSIAPFLAVAMLLVLVVGLGAGMAYLAGITLLGTDVEDEVRGRVFGFIQSAVRIVLMLSTAASSLIVGLGGRHTVFLGEISFTANVSRPLLFLGGLAAGAIGLLALHQLDDRPGVPLIGDVIASVRRRAVAGGSSPGFLVAFEGGEGSGKSTQVVRLAESLAAAGFDVVSTREPGATEVGVQIRALLLDPAHRPDARTEAMLYAADRAEHVARVIRPSMARGAIVLTDRFTDSSRAYQGAGRQVTGEEVERLADWATDGLTPDLVVLLDIDPVEGLARAATRSGAADRLEAESLEFHRRVRGAFRQIARDHPERYLVLDATDPVENIEARVRERIGALLHAARVAGGPVSPGSTSSGVAR